MKILIIRMFPDEMNINNYNVQEIGLAKALIKKENKCDIILYTEKDEPYEQIIETENGGQIKIYWQKGENYLKNVKYTDQIYDIIEKYDIIQLSEYDQIQNLEIIEKANKPIIIYHGPYYDKFNLNNYKYNLKCKLQDTFIINKNKQYKEIKFITKSKLAEEFLKKKGFLNVKTIGVGLDNTRLDSNESSKNEFIDKLKKEKEEKNYRYLLYVGKIEKRRNIKFLIKILKGISEKNSKVRLVLVGKGEEKYRDSIFEYAKKVGVFDKIIYKESIEQKNIKNLYNTSDIFLLPTSYEIFGMVLLEAMYLGKPVITTENGGSSTIINNNSFVYSLHEKEKWIETIDKLLNSPQFYDEISKKASEYIEENFIWDKLAEKFIEQYEETIENYNKRGKIDGQRNFKTK